MSNFFIVVEEGDLNSLGISASEIGSEVQINQNRVKYCKAEYLFSRYGDYVAEVDAKYISEVDSTDGTCEFNGVLVFNKLWTVEFLNHAIELNTNLHGGDELFIRGCLSEESLHSYLFEFLKAGIDYQIVERDKSVLDAAIYFGAKLDLIELLIARGADRMKSTFAIPAALSNDYLQKITDYFERSKSELTDNNNVDEFISKLEDLKVKELSEAQKEEALSLGLCVFNNTLYDPELWKVYTRVGRDRKKHSMLKYIGESPYIKGIYFARSLEGAFRQRNDLPFIDLRQLNLSRCTNYKLAFTDCSNVQFILGPIKNTSYALVNTSVYACKGCTSLTSFEFEYINFAEGNIRSMFEDCTNLIHVVCRELVKYDKLIADVDTKFDAINTIIDNSDLESDAANVFYNAIMAFKGCCKDVNVYTNSCPDGITSICNLLEICDLPLDSPESNEVNMNTEVESGYINFDDQIYDENVDSVPDDFDEGDLDEVCLPQNYAMPPKPINVMVNEWAEGKAYRDDVTARILKLVYRKTGSYSMANLDNSFWSGVTEDEANMYGFSVFDGNMPDYYMGNGVTGYRVIYDPNLWCIEQYMEGNDEIQYLRYTKNDPYVVGVYGAVDLTRAFMNSPFEYLDLSNLNLKYVRRWDSTFMMCSDLQYIKLPEKIGCCVSMRGMFYGCSNLTELDLSGIKVDSLIPETKYIDCDYMLSGCPSLRFLGLPEPVTTLLDMVYEEIPNEEKKWKINVKAGWNAYLSLIKKLSSKGSKINRLALDSMVGLVTILNTSSKTISAISAKTNQTDIKLLLLAAKMGDKYNIDFVPNEFRGIIDTKTSWLDSILQFIKSLVDKVKQSYVDIAVDHANKSVSRE